MNNYWLKGDFKDLYDKVQLQIEKAEQLKAVSITSNETLKEEKSRKQEWLDETIEILNNCFVEPNNNLITAFKGLHPYSNPFITYGQQTTLQQEVEKYIDSISCYINGLSSFIDDVVLSDIICEPNSVNIEERKSWSIEDRQLLILRKLSKAKRGLYYDIKLIMELNGIELSYSDEVSDLIEDLENMGLVEQFKGAVDNHAKITIQGLKFVEQKQSISSNERQFERPSVEEVEAMTVKIDEIIEYLKKAGVEREILFEEMQELKELYLKLSKKNWKQILLGKLVDLGLSKVLEKESVHYIYEQLTGLHQNLL